MDAVTIWGEDPSKLFDAHEPLITFNLYLPVQQNAIVSHRQVRRVSLDPSKSKAFNLIIPPSAYVTTNLPRAFNNPNIKGE